MTTHIGIIGAGIAGLTAARTLHDHGQEVTLFDKARGVGGRTSVRRRDAFEFDHGAQYFTARDKNFRNLLEQWRQACVAAEWTGRIVALAAGEVRASTSETRYVATPGMNALAKHLATDLAPTLQTRVERITHQADKWHLTRDDDTNLGSFDALVLALPAAQAAVLLDDHSPIAAKARACRLAPCWAVMLGFAEAVDVPFDGAFIHHSPLSWIARNNSKPHRPSAEAWVLHANPEWSAQHLEDDPTHVADVLTTEFFNRLDVTPRPPAITDTHRWRYALPPAPLDVGCLHDPDRRLLICGDWCRGARLEGAFLSGHAAAQRLLNSPGFQPPA